MQCNFINIAEKFIFITVNCAFFSIFGKYENVLITSQYSRFANGQLGGIIMKKIFGVLLGACSCLSSSVQSDVIYPDTLPKQATAKTQDNKFTLSNNLLSSTWTVENGVLKAPSSTNRKTKSQMKSGQNLFGLSLTKQVVDTNWVYVGVKIGKENIKALVSTDGKSWDLLGTLPKSDFNASPQLLRVGKVDSKGGSKDYYDAGEFGESEFLSVQATNANGKTLALTGKPTKIHKSKHVGTTLNINNERGTIKAAANTTAYSEYTLSGNSTFFSCRLKKGSDQGMTWGPGLTLVFNDNKFITVGIRAKGTFNLNSSVDEKIIPFKVQSGLNCDLSSNDFKTKKINVKNKKWGSH